jgi:4-amino-4-deoxy-L-arabinose transferase-like glycosyltransferase
MTLPLDHISWQTNDSPVFGHLFLYEYNDFFDEIAFLVRFPILLLSVLMAVLVYGWAKELYGTRAGLLALFLYTFSPSVLGNSGLAMADIGGTFFIAIAVYVFWRFLRRSTFGGLVMCGISFGLAQASKHTAVILVPFYVFILIFDAAGAEAFWKRLFRRFLDLCGIFLIGFIVLWATYAFEFQPLLENAPDVGEKIGYIKAFADKLPFENKGFIADQLIYFAQKVPIPLPSFIISLLGVSNQVINAGQPLFFMGENYLTGLWFYYIFLFFIKVPLPLIILIFFAVLGSFMKKRTKKSPIDNLCLLMPLFLIFTAVSMSKVQGGIRYLLPFFPFLYIWLSDSVNVKIKGQSARLAGNIFFSVIILWYAWAGISVFPHFLGYYNELTGGAGGTAHKITYDMDWGQDLKFLAEYTRDNGIKEISLLYFGTADPAKYGVNAVDITPQERQYPRGKVYAVSVRYLGAVKWTEKYKPDAKAGYSIFIYDMRNKKVKS